VEDNNSAQVQELQVHVRQHNRYHQVEQGTIFEG
jgi:hypothetical protein